MIKQAIKLFLSMVISLLIVGGTANANIEPEPDKLELYHLMDRLYDLSIISMLDQNFTESQGHLDQLSLLIHENFEADSPEKLVFLTAQALVGQEAGDFEKAVQAQSQFEIIKKQNKSHEKYDEAIHRVMRMYAMTGRPENIRLMIKETVQGHKPLPASGGDIDQLFNVINTLSSLKKYIPSEEPFLAPYREVSELQQELSKVAEQYGKSSLQYGYMMFRLGVFHYNSKNYTDAISAFEELDSTGFLSLNHPHRVIFLHYLAHSYKFADQHQKGDAIIADLKQMITQIDFYIRNGFSKPEKAPYGASFAGAIVGNAGEQFTALFKATDMGNESYDPKLRAKRVKIWHPSYLVKSS